MGFTQWAAAGMVGFGVGAATTYVILSPQLVPQSAAPSPLSSSRSALAQKLVKYGLPEGDGVVQIEDTFATSFDSRTRNPKWVLERLTKDTVNGPGDRSDCYFYEDDAIDPLFRPTLSDYKRSGYDRGHLAPAASHKSSQNEMAKTFSLSNISPQVGSGFNQTYWARFEKFVKDLCKQSDEVFVVTGPLWLPTMGDGGWQANHKFIGKPPALVAVPTHFYKVILADNKVAAFVMPNQPIDPKKNLLDFIVPLENLESVAGLRFFPKRLAPNSANYMDYKAKEQRYFKSSLGRQDQLALPGTSTAITTTKVRDIPKASSDTGSQNSSSIISTFSFPAPSLVPLCDTVECQLPGEKFWEKK